MKKAVTFLLAAAIALGGALGPSPAYAHGARLWLLFYYAEMDMVNVVGYAVEYCDGHTAYGGNPTIWPLYQDVEGCD